MLKLYGVGRSRAAKNLWALREIGVPFEHVPVIQAFRLPDASAPDAPLNTLSPDFFAISPAGAVPVLVDGDLILTESAAINLYLAKVHGHDLGPKDEAEAALMTSWSLYAATSVEPAALQSLQVYGQKRDATPEGQAELERHAATLARPLGVIEAHLAKAGHIVGGRFTIADINVAEILRYAQAHAPLLAGRPAITAWLAACQSRPAFKAMMDARNAEPL